MKRMPESIAFCTWTRRLLGVELVVVGDDLELAGPTTPPWALVTVGEILEGLEADLADARSAAGQRIDVGDLDVVLGGVPAGRGDRGSGRYGAEAWL